MLSYEPAGYFDDAVITREEVTLSGLPDLTAEVTGCETVRSASQTMPLTVTVSVEKADGRPMSWSLERVYGTTVEGETVPMPVLEVEEMDWVTGEIDFAIFRSK